MLTFLKLGGSLITDKDSPYSPRLDVLARLAAEIHSGITHAPGLKLLLGHGSGSFGHIEAKKYGTHHGVHSPQDWFGFAEVWYQAATLNRLVIEALHAKKLSPIAFPASASIVGHNRQVRQWDLSGINSALEAGLIPVTYGDVVFDRKIGGTIVSTEDLFVFLATKMRPKRILLAGLEPGVWKDYPNGAAVVPHINASNIQHIISAVSDSASTDVTGGMLSKVQQMYTLCQNLPDLVVQIFSGRNPGLLERALQGEQVGTKISA